MKVENNPAFEAGLAEIQQRLGNNKELTLCVSSMQPMECLNSSSRKLMHTQHYMQHTTPKYPEVALIQTGTENQFGHESTSYQEAECDWTVVAKISKHAMYPDHHYYLIVVNQQNEMKMIERVAYKHTTETFGFLWNNNYLDSIDVGSTIPKGKPYKTSNCFDDYGNYMSGLNALSTYMSLPNTTEDPVVISKSFQSRASSPEFKKITFVVNDNDVLTNLYGDDEIYKCFPDLGEEVQNGILCAIRRSTTEEALYARSRENLRRIMISDEVITAKEGKVVDIEISSNKRLLPGMEEGDLYNCYEGQIASYIDDELRFCRQFVEALALYIDNRDYTKSYEIQKMYNLCVRKLRGDQYIQDGKVFSNVIITFTIYCDHHLEVADKISNRHGGKGVIAEVRDDNLMPRLPNGEIIDIIWDESTCVNRLNIAQLSEISLNRIGRAITDFIDTKVLHADEALEMILKYYDMLSETFGDYMRDQFESCTTDYELLDLLSAYLEANDKGIYLSLKPITEVVDFDKLRSIYHEFSWIQQEQLLVPMQNSDGTYRYIASSKPSTVGEQYIYILKQKAEEKHSATSLSSTNIRNENAKSRAAKNYRSPIANTPIRWGEMENTIFIHEGPEIVVTNLMLYSTSTSGRRDAMQIYTGDPYNIDVKLSPDARSRSAETVKTLMMGMGLEIDFIKIPKVNMGSPFVFVERNDYSPFVRVIRESPFVRVERHEESPFVFVERHEESPFVRVLKEDSE